MTGPLGETMPLEAQARGGTPESLAMEKLEETSDVKLDTTHGIIVDPAHLPGHVLGSDAIQTTRPGQVQRRVRPS